MIKYNKRHVQILQKHYREVLAGASLTHEQIVAELENLLRKEKGMSLDDKGGYLLASLQIAGEFVFSDD